MPYRNNYWRSLMGSRAQVLMSLGVAYTAQATYSAFVANSAQGELGVFNATTLALVAGNAAVTALTPVFIAVNRGGQKGPWTNSPQVPGVIEKSTVFPAGQLTATRQPYSAPVLQITQVVLGSHASLVIGDITYVAKAAGGASAITIAYVVAGASTPLTVVVTGNAIVVNLATSAGSAAISTAAQVLAAVQASAPATALVSSTLTGVGTNVQAALAATNLTGGSAASTVTPGFIYSLSILETTIGFQQFPIWPYQYVAVAGDTEDGIMAKLVTMINSTTSIANRDRDLVVTAAYAVGILTLTAIYFGSTFNVFLPGIQLPASSPTDNQLANIVSVIRTPVTCHAGSGSSDQARLFQMVGDVYKGVTTQYPNQGAQPIDYGQPNDFVALNAVQNFDIFIFTGYTSEASRTFLHQQQWHVTIFVLVPTSGTTPTTQLQTIFGTT